MEKGDIEIPLFSPLHLPPPHFGSIFSTDTLKDMAALEIDFANKHKRGNIA